MSYKTLFLFIVSFICLNKPKAQILCDTTVTICDSVFIDSIVFTESPQTGDRVHFIFTSEHEFLHGPIIFICPNDDNIEFIDNAEPFFGIVGPSTVNASYQFINFEIVGDTLEGHLVMDNQNNLFPNCAILFKTSLDGFSTSTINNQLETQVKIHPNPAKNYLSINLNDNQLTGNKIQLFDLLGRQQKIEYSNNEIDLKSVPPGVYILSFEVNHTKLVTKKIIKH